MAETTSPNKTENGFVAVRKLWREWDPIGVFRFQDGFDVDDEYDDYVAECLCLIEAGDRPKLLSYLESVVVGTMGIKPQGLVSLDHQAFAERLMKAKSAT